LADHDAVIVGSGVNGLACAALLAKGGWDVCVLERNDWFGGAIKTAHLTAPGFLHDVYSAWHPLWVGGPAHAQLGDDLARHGLEYLNTELPTATLYPDGASAFLLRTAEANATELDRHHLGDGEGWLAMLGEFLPNADFAFGVLGTELWSRHGAALALKAVRRLGREGARDFTGKLLISARDWLEEAFISERAHGLLAPWVLHTGLGPDAAASGYMAQVIAVAVQEGGMPIPRGGGQKLADALVAYIREQGGTCETGADVQRVFPKGVRTADGTTIGARRRRTRRASARATARARPPRRPTTPRRRPRRHPPPPMPPRLAPRSHPRRSAASAASPTRRRTRRAGDATTARADHRVDRRRPSSRRHSRRSAEAEPAGAA